METVVNSKGQITIPSKIRKQLGIKEGTRIVFSIDGTSIVAKPMTEDRLKVLQGSLKGQGLLKALLAEKKREREL